MHRSRLALIAALVLGALAVVPGVAQEADTGSLVVSGTICPAGYAGDQLEEDCATPAAGARYQARNPATGEAHPLTRVTAGRDGMAEFRDLSGLVPGTLWILVDAPEAEVITGGYDVLLFACVADGDRVASPVPVESGYTGRIFALDVQDGDDLHCDIVFAPLTLRGEPGTVVPTHEATPSPDTITTVAVCVGGGGESLKGETWTGEEIAAEEARTGPVLKADAATGTCRDLAGRTLPGDALSWACMRTAEELWYGPVWTAERYLPADAVPPNVTLGGCPSPRDEDIPPRPDPEQAAATAVYLTQLLASGELDKPYAWLHPDAQAVIPGEVFGGWYAAEWLSRGPQDINVKRVEFTEWLWPVTGKTYANVAEITYDQALADGTVTHGFMHLVQDDQGVWRWLFGEDQPFVDEQLARFAHKDDAAKGPARASPSCIPTHSRRPWS